MEGLIFILMVREIATPAQPVSLMAGSQYNVGIQEVLVSAALPSRTTPKSHPEWCGARLFL